VHKKILFAVEQALRKSIIPDVLENVVSKENKGIEAYFYPYINIELLSLIDRNNVIGIGSGRIQPDKNEREEYDIGIYQPNKTVLIEIKGPAPVNYLLGGASGKRDNPPYQLLNLQRRRLSKAYRRILSISTKEFIFDDCHLGDILKLQHQVLYGSASKGYAVAIYKYKKDSMPFGYRKAIIEMMRILGLSYRVYIRPVSDYCSYICVVEIR
jgi:hypothetical protein